MAFDVRGKICNVVINTIPYAQLRAAGDHNCLFHATGYALQQLGGAIALRVADLDHAGLRTLVCGRIDTLLNGVDTLGETKTRCRLFVDAQTDVGTEGEKIIAYLASMRQPGTWGDSLCVYAIEAEFGVRVEVYHLDGQGRVHTGNFPSRDAAEDHTIRLITPPTAQKGVYNHFNPLVANPPVDDAHPVVADPQEKPRPLEAVPYWKPEKLRLYEPPVAHSMFGDRWTRRVTRSLTKLFTSNGNSHQVDLLAPAVASVSLSSTATKLDSHSFRAADLDGKKVTKDTAYHEAFTMPLAYDDAKLATETVDASTVTVKLALQRYAQVASVTFTLYSRTGAPITKTVLKVVLDKGKTMEAELPSGTGRVPVQLVEIALTAVFDAKDLGALGWVDSPYQLVAAANGNPDDRTTEPVAWAWTYLHVPNAWDVNTTAGVATARVLLVEDDLTTFKTVDKASAKARTNGTDEEVDLPEGVRAKTDPETGGEIPGQLQRMIASLGDTNFTNYDPNTISALWENEDGSWDVMTSWASIAVLVHDEPSGGLCLHSLLIEGKRAVFAFSKEARALAGKSEPIRLLSAYADALAKENYESKAGGSDAKARLQKAKTLVEASEQEIRKNEETMKVLVALPTGTAAVKLATVKGKLVELKEAGKEDTRLLNDASRVAGIGQVEGEKDFDNPRNKAATYSPWTQYFFPPGMRVNKAVTRGISSCAGGVTFPIGKKGPPEAIILWHIDAAPSVPVKQIIAQLWPKLDECPDLRTIAFVFPERGEFNKYREAILYPATIRDRCKTVFMARGPHLGVLSFNLGSGADYFGVATTKDGADLVFTHDLSKRTEVIGKRNTARSDAEVSVTLKAFQQNCFGTYRYDDLPVAQDDKVAMLQYVDIMGVSDPGVKRDKIAKGHMCRLPGLGAGLFDAVDAKAKPVVDIECWMLGQKLELEFAKTSVKEVLDTRWTPGPRRE